MDLDITSINNQLGQVKYQNCKILCVHIAHPNIPLMGACEHQYVVLTELGYSWRDGNGLGCIGMGCRTG